MGIRAITLRKQSHSKPKATAKEAATVAVKIVATFIFVTSGQRCDCAAQVHMARPVPSASHCNERRYGIAAMPLAWAAGHSVKEGRAASLFGYN
jgi:hypothetical protein